MAAKYAINLKDCTIVYRSKATDAMPVLFRWIPDEVAKGIMDKQIDAKSVVNVIMKKVFQSEDFDHSEYEAELKKLNVVFKDEEVPEPEEVVNTTADNPADSVTMDELTGGDNPAGGDAPKKSKKSKKTETAESPEKPETPASPDGEENLDI